jgi:translation initiation factor IF-3
MQPAPSRHAPFSTSQSIRVRIAAAASPDDIDKPNKSHATNFNSLVTLSTGKGTGIERTQRINEQIRISPVRVISADGELLGIINTDEALARAREADLDLVEVAPNERPPVCRIMDFGKFKYQQKKRLAKGHTHHSKIKEIRVRPKTGEHDIGFKVNQARTFLQHKDKVVVSVIFRGRELAHIEEGRKVIDHVIKELEEVGKIESPPSHQGKRIVAILAPK